MVIYEAMPPSTWSVLADPHRRAALELLRERPRPVGELVERLDALERHLDSTRTEED